MWSSIQAYLVILCSRSHILNKFLWPQWYCWFNGPHVIWLFVYLLSYKSGWPLKHFLTRKIKGYSVFWQTCLNKNRWFCVWFWPWRFKQLDHLHALSCPHPLTPSHPRSHSRLRVYNEHMSNDWCRNSFSHEISFMKYANILPFVHVRIIECFKTMTAPSSFLVSWW